MIITNTQAPGDTPRRNRDENGQPVVRRQSRALRILNCLQAGPSFNARELATQMNVSRRTIYRDLNLIRDAGIRIDFDDEQSGYRVTSASGSDIVPPRLNRVDLAKLVLAAKLSLLNGLPHFSGPFRESMAQLLNHSPVDVRDDITRLLNSCEVDIPQPNYPQRAVELLDTVLAAITHARMLRIKIKRRQEEAASWTRFAPYRITGGLTSWTITGRSSVHQRTLTLPLDEILSWETTMDPYRIPRGFRTRPSAARSA